MKKIALLLPFLFVFCYCSTDDSINTEEALLLAADEGKRDGEEFNEKAITYPQCFTGITASVRVDVSGGFGNPVLVFTPAMSSNVSFMDEFYVKVEVRALSDCDNMSGTIGGTMSFGPSGTVKNVNPKPPVITVLPSALPTCYKWRYVFEGINSFGAKICASYSQWYESPVF